MGITLTMFLILTTCNTWTGVCAPPVETQWTVGIPGWGTPTLHLRRAIEKCRIKGIERAHKLTGIADPFGENHVSTRVKCKHELGQGV
jgi:hypothetical protein